MLIFISGNIIKSVHFSEHFEALLGKLKDSHPHVKLMGYLVALALVKKLSKDRQIDVAHEIIATINLNELSGVDDSSQEHLALGVSNVDPLIYSHHSRIYSVCGV